MRESSLSTLMVCWRSPANTARPAFLLPHRTSLCPHRTSLLPLGTSLLLGDSFTPSQRLPPPSSLFFQSPLSSLVSPPHTSLFLRTNSLLFLLHLLSYALLPLAAPPSFSPRSCSSLLPPPSSLLSPLLLCFLSSLLLSRAAALLLLCSDADGLDPPKTPEANGFDVMRECVEGECDEGMQVKRFSEGKGSFDNEVTERRWSRVSGMRSRRGMACDEV